MSSPAKHPFRASLFAVCCLLLSACGTRGPLTLPPKNIKAPAPAPAPAAPPTPVTTPATPAADDSSAPPATTAQ